MNLVYVAVAAGSLAFGGLIISRTVAQPVRESDPGASAVDANKVVITMGDTKVTAGEFQNFVNSLPPDVRALATGGGKRTLGEELVRLKLLAAEAQRRGIQDTPAFKQQLAIMRDNLLVGLLAQQFGGAVSDDDIKAYYDSHKPEFEQAKVRDIFIPVGGDSGLTDAQARARATEIRKRIQNGEKFADVAKAESADQSTAKDGGDVPPFPKGTTEPEFEKAAFSMKPGELSQPVKTEKGYHIILLESRDIPDFDKMKDAIGDKLRQQKFEDFYDQLKDKANPRFDDQFFPPAKDTDKKGQ